MDKFFMGYPGERWEASLAVLVIPVRGLEHLSILVTKRVDVFTIVSGTEIEEADCLLMASALVEEQFKRYHER